MDWFKGKPDTTPSPKPVPIESVERESVDSPEHYEADDGLIRAVNVALYLAQPLLLCGEVGSGKTSLAQRVAWELGWAHFKFEAKSNSQAHELFYQFDALARFQAAYGPERKNLDPLRFVTYGAMGRAILQGMGLSAAQRFFPHGQLPPWLRPESQRSVVLIDEIDKAPRDFPNDILNELEQYYFRIREADDLAVGLDESGRPVLREAPVVIITSNLEKQLPDAFLRRCIFFALPKIDAGRLERIVQRRVSLRLNTTSSPLLRDALDCFFALRNPAVELSKPPSTAEFVAWMFALLRSGGSEDKPLSVALAKTCIAALTKTEGDQAKAKDVISSKLGPA